jgi:tRNA threonylcarbamoyl adenosine modification protein YeaZ
MSEATVMLAWDTCTEDGVIAVSENDAILGGSRFRTVKGHAGWLMPLVDAALKAAAREPRNIDMIAAGIGPGGYTGVKVGVSTAKALALALGVPLIGVPTLDLLAAHAPDGRGPVLACMDARQGLVYAAGYSGTGAGCKRMTGYMCVGPAEAGLLAARLGDASVTAIGYVPHETLDAAMRARVTLSVAQPAEVGFPSGEILVALAREMMEAGLGGDAFSVVPIYLKKPV